MEESTAIAVIVLGLFSIFGVGMMFDKYQSHESYRACIQVPVEKRDLPCVQPGIDVTRINKEKK